MPDKNQVIYMTHDYDLVENFNSRFERCHIIDLENLLNL